MPNYTLTFLMKLVGPMSLCVTYSIIIGLLRVDSMGMIYCR